jgi:Protein of unknown function, DUF481
MKTKKSFIIFFSILCYLNVFAQEENKKHKFTGNVSLTGNIQTGNSERILLINNVNYKIESTSKKTAFNSKNRYVYGTVGDFLKENDFRTSNYLTFNADKKWNPIVGFYFETLRIKKMKSSIKPLAGIQYKLVNTKKLKLSPRVLLGYSWQKYDGINFENFNNNGEDDINGTSINFGLNATINPFDGKVIFNLFSIYQLGVEETKNQRLWFDFNTLVPIYKGLSFRLSLNNYYENIVLQGVKNNDLNIAYGLGYNF